MQTHSENANTVQKADDEYVPVAVAVIPESVSLASLNDQNKHYWNRAGNPDMVEGE